LYTYGRMGEGGRRHLKHLEIQSENMTKHTHDGSPLTMHPAPHILVFTLLEEWPGN